MILKNKYSVVFHSLALILMSFAQLTQHQLKQTFIINWYNCRTLDNIIAPAVVELRGLSNFVSQNKDEVPKYLIIKLLHFRVENGDLEFNLVLNK